MRDEKVSRRVLAIGALLAFALTGCRSSEAAIADGDSPMAALGVRTPTTKYVNEYWLDQARRGTVLWDSAFAFCSGYLKQNDGSKPNCGHIYTAHFHHSGATTPIRRKNMTVDSLAPR